MTAATFQLSANPAEAHKTLAGIVWQQIKALAMAGHGTEVTVKPAKRSTDQTCSGSVTSGSARINALLGQVVHRLTSHHRAFAETGTHGRCQFLSDSSSDSTW